MTFQAVVQARFQTVALAGWLVAAPVAVAITAAPALARVDARPMTWNQFQQANAARGWDSERMSQEWQEYKAEVAGARSVRRDHADRSVDQGTETGTQVPATIPARAAGSGIPWLGLGFFALVLAALAYSWSRRRKRAAGQADAELKEALKLPEATMTEVYLSLDGLEDHPDFPALMERATAVTEQLDDLKAHSSDPSANSRARALAGEARAVRAAFDQARRTLPRA